MYICMQRIHVCHTNAFVVFFKVFEFKKEKETFVMREHKLSFVSFTYPVHMSARTVSNAFIVL
jgi:hypothetical protein